MIFKLHVIGKAPLSVTLTHSTVTANGISCSATPCAGSGTKLTTPSVVGVYIGMDNVAAGRIEICASSTQYMDFAIINSDYRGRVSYDYRESRFTWCVGAGS